MKGRNKVIARITLSIMEFRLRMQEKYPGPQYTPVDLNLMAELRQELGQK